MDRVSGETGYCGAGSVMEVASLVIHRGEEPFLAGRTGVGNVFFNHCSMSCVYCQNYQISRHGGGTEHSPDSLAQELLIFQEQGCPTVGFVSPGHYLPLVAETIIAARGKGLTVPVIWNSNGFETVEALELLEGLVDIYLPDLKYWSEESSVVYSDTPGYAETARASIREMFRQTGVLRTENGTATGGLCIRHLVLPNDLADTEEILRFIASVSTEISVSLMSQYNPVHRAREFALLSRKLRPSEYWKAVETAEILGISNILTQEPDSSPGHYLPDFRKRDVFN
ncbi:MAG: radical SAM protein [Candidatus Sabulitectum sp.]|nr:radical SAM protein [Candidatus Sabulitectum sp.]